MYNLYDRRGLDGALAELCIKNDIGVLTYFAMGASFLTGKYRNTADIEGKPRSSLIARYFDERGMRILDALDTVAAETDAEPATIALAWVTRRSGVAATLASVTSSQQLNAMIAAVTLKLSDAHLQLLDEAST